MFVFDTFQSIFVFNIADIVFENIDWLRVRVHEELEASNYEYSNPIK